MVTPSHIGGRAWLEEGKERNMSNTQKQMILDYMVQYGSISTFEAFTDLGVTKLTTRISELRKDGYPIKGEPMTAKNRFGRQISYNIYSLED